MIREFAGKAARILLIEESGAGRQMLSDVLRCCGFSDIRVVSSGCDALRVMESERIDWLVTSSLQKQTVNALHLLKLIAEQPELRRIRTSMIADDADEAIIDAAFALGLMSVHERDDGRETMQGEFQQLLSLLKSFGWRPQLVAAEYLRRRLVRAGRYEDLIAMQGRLLQVFPGSPTVLVRLGESLLAAGRHGDGISAISQAILLDEKFKEPGQAVIVKATGMNVTARVQKGAGLNALGCETCVIVDPDSAVLATIGGLLKDAGVRQVEMFEDGVSAWRWLQSHPEPGLIMHEWRLPGLSGSLLLQRIRQHGFLSVPVVVISSMIKPNEVPLLKEMSVDSVIAKPFNQQVFFKNITWTLQQRACPTEQKALERSMRSLLEKGRIREAKRLKAIFTDDVRISGAAKKEIEAEFCYCQQRYRQARDQGIEALRMGGESLLVLSLIGRSLLKMGDYPAALKFFEKANSLSPNNVAHVCDMAMSSFAAGEFINADSLLKRAREMDRGNVRVIETSCQHAIIRYQSEEAKKLMASLQSPDRIVAFLNERAAALVRSGCYDDGVKLYASTMEALPEEFSELRAVISYNMALAYVRGGDFAKALTGLTALATGHDSPIKEKADVLAKRVKNSETTGAALSLKDENLEEVFTAVEFIQETMPGEVCLKDIFELTPGPEAVRLLADPPSFKKRPAMEPGEVIIQ